MSTAFLQFRLLRAAKFDSFVSGLSVLHGRLRSFFRFFTTDVFTANQKLTTTHSISPFYTTTY